jgi:hypothetical protein
VYLCALAKWPWWLIFFIPGFSLTRLFSSIKVVAVPKAEVLEPPHLSKESDSIFFKVTLKKTRFLSFSF